MSVRAEVSSSPRTSDDVRPEVSPLSVLLDQEYYLIKILPHLIEDGLHECRRVCRKWKSICDGLPVNLGSIDVMEVEGAAALFPNAISLRSHVETKIAGARSTQCLGSFRQLRHLTLIYNRDRIEPCSNVDPIPHDHQLYPQSLQNLVSLDVRRMPTKWSQCFYAFLSELTNLTSLKLESFRPQDTPNEPFTNLKCLNELSVGLQFFTEQTEDYFFPVLPYLTHLSVKAEPNPFRQGGIRVIEKVLPYVMTVESLKIEFPAPVCPMFRSHIEDWPLLLFFERLTSFSVKFQPTQGDFFNTIRKMTQLTRLYLSCEPCEFVTDLIPIYTLTKLKSLTLYTPAQLFVEPEWLLIYHLTRLTFLATSVKLRKTILLPNPSDLIHLELFQPPIVLCGLDGCPFSSSRLEHLSLSKVKGSELSSKSFSSFGKLKKLDLEISDNTISEDLFSALACLRELTSLKFWAVGRGPFPLHFRFQFNKLTNLISLSLSFKDPEDAGKKSNPCTYFQKGKLPFLRTLDLQHTKLTYEDETELWKKFPCLRNLWFSGNYRNHF